MKWLTGLALLAFAGCWTFDQSEFPDVSLTAAPGGQDVKVQLAGFSATVTSYAVAYTYTTVADPFPRGPDRYGRFWGPTTYSTQTYVPQVSQTSAFLDRATESMEKAGFVMRAPNPQYRVEVRFEGPTVTAGESWASVGWSVLTLFTADRGYQTWAAKMKIHDVASGRLLMEHAYEQSYHATVWGPLPFLSPAGADATSPGVMKGWCLSALTDRAIADATSFLAEQRK